MKRGFLLRFLSLSTLLLAQLHEVVECYILNFFKVLNQISLVILYFLQIFVIKPQLGLLVEEIGVYVTCLQLKASTF